MNKYCLTAGLLFLCISLIGGCTNKNPLGAVKVTGIVTLDGKPVTWASITFHPKSEKLPVASGRTNENGAFVLTPVGGVGGEGALAGDYRISMTRSTLTEKEMYHVGGSSIGVSSNENNMPKYVPRKDFFPEKYTKPETSGFEVSVVKGQKNHFEFHCISQ
ncbi:MAG: hypothetical protein LBG58_12000 [Planctomycetaceae bacterium]|jgi:hypothetical protein|nr:hypothetical protein [Planctomycetaceae bacterium]